MKSDELRQKFLDFFKKRGHFVISSVSLIPEGAQKETLFIGSGMQPLIPYLLGQKHSLGQRLVNYQRCFRAEDIEEVGDNRHTTFFEMLGNWSLGDYWKEEQLSWFFEFLTDKKDGMGIDPNRLYVTVFDGDKKNKIPKDNESMEIWKKLFSEKGIEVKDEERIFGYGVKKNWWSISGEPENMPSGEIGGPDSEVFYRFDVEHDKKFGEKCHPNCDCGRFLEIGNSVFIEFRKTEEGDFEKLGQRNVDFGGGLERITAATNNDPDIFKIDIFDLVREELEKISGEKYGDNPETTRIFRILIDQIRAALFIMAAGVIPSNTKQGYVLRRLLRRSIFFSRRIHRDKEKGASLALSALGELFSRTYNNIYPELLERIREIDSFIVDEEIKFDLALNQGMRELERMGSSIDAFKLFTTFGFPIEITEEIAREKGITLDRRKFDEELKKHQEISRAGAGTFKGGLADTKPETIRLHTAHHLLLAALQKVLGSHVKQRGSNITSERLRMDFVHSAKLTNEEFREVEDIVNQKISEGLVVVRREIPKEEAEKIGAEMEFGVKYGDVVSVYFIEDKEGNIFSKEFCGGPHVSNTGEIGVFKIIKEEAVSAGVRRIRGRLE